MKLKLSRHSELHLPNMLRSNLLRRPKNLVLLSVIPAGSENSPNILIKLLMFTLMSVHIAEAKIFLHATIQPSIPKKILKMGSSKLLVLCICSTGVLNVKILFMDGEKTRFSMLLLGLRSELWLLFSGISSKFPMVIFPEFLNTSVNLCLRPVPFSGIIRSCKWLNLADFLSKE